MYNQSLRPGWFAIVHISRQEKVVTPGQNATLRRSTERYTTDSTHRWQRAEGVVWMAEDPRESRFKWACLCRMYSTIKTFAACRIKTCQFDLDLPYSLRWAFLPSFLRWLKKNTLVQKNVKRTKYLVQRGKYTHKKVDKKKHTSYKKKHVYIQ